MKPKLLSKKQRAALRFRNARLQESSRRVYASAVDGYFRYLVKHGHDDQFDVERIKEWLNKYTNAATYNLKLQGIKEFYFKQVEHRPGVHRLKVREAFETIKRKKPMRAKLHSLNYLHQKQIMHLAERCTDRISLAIRALFWTGCRISELAGIALKDCKPGDPVAIRVMGKGLKERIVYLPRREYDEIRKVFKGKRYLFETTAGTPYRPDSISKEIRRQAKLKTGLSVHAHTMRHSKAMYLKARNMTPDQIAKALGHADVTVTLAYYLHGTPSPEDQGM